MATATGKPDRVTHRKVVRRKTTRLFRLVLPAFLLLVLWEIGARVLFDPQYVGEPLYIAISLYQHALSASMWLDTWVTFKETILGFMLGLVSGASVGYILGFKQNWAAIVEPYILALNSVPKIAIAPLLIIMLGIGITSKIAIAASMVFFLVFYNVFAGIKMIDIDFIYQAKLIGANGRTVIRHVILPFIMPNLLASMKTSIVYAMIGAIIGELIAARNGLGYFILNAAGVFNVTDVWVGVVFIMVLVQAMSGLITCAERRWLRWLPPTRI